MGPYLLVAVGAVVGANARYWVSLQTARRLGVGFPYGTLIINVSGSLLIGFVLARLAAQTGLEPSGRLLLATGFCGGYTTFSTFAFETAAFLRRGSPVAAFANVAGSTALGVAAAAVGIAVAGLLR